MTDLVTQYRGQTYRTIEWRFRRSGVPEEMIEQTVNAIKQARAELTKSSLRKRRMRAAWAEIIEALQHERRIVRSMMNYKTATPSPEREDFCANYYYVLNELHTRLTKNKRNYVPVEHSHWSDYVPLKIKSALVEAANSIPARARARVKQPFMRTLPLNVFDRRKGRLLRSTRASMHTAEARGDTEHAELLQKVIDLINEIPVGDHIPNTWQEVLKKHEDDEERGLSDE